jgi:DNA-binding NarL/FixJ family response regulator
MTIEARHHESNQLPKQIMTNLDHVKVSPREQQVLNLLVQGCSNKEIGVQLNISLRTVKEHMRMLFLRAGIREGAKRVKLARYVHEDEDAVMPLCETLSPRENQISILVWEGLTNREIGKIIGIKEQVIKNHLRRAFDKLGAWTRLELAMYVADHGGKESTYRDRPPQYVPTLERSSPIPPPLTFHL